MTLQNNDGQFSRRRVLRVGAAAAVGAASVVVVGNSVADATPSREGAGQLVSATSDEPPPLLGRVSDRNGVQVAVKRPAASIPDVVTNELHLPLVGFPVGVTPRSGDLVGVVRDSTGVAIAAAPMCHWITGVVSAQGDGRMTISGTRLAPSQLVSTGRSASVCVLDTELLDAQVLAVRPA